MKSDYVYQYDCYKGVIRHWLANQPAKGRGLMKQIASELKVHPSFVSQVMKDAKDLSLEQALSLTAILGLGGEEQDYFLTLVSEARAGSHSLREFYADKRKRQQKFAHNVQSKIARSKELSTAERSRFYSDAIYSQVRILASIPRYQTASAISRVLGLSESKIREVIDFLTANDLVVVDGEDRVTIGPARTHLSSNSPFIGNHHRNWRLQVLQQLPLVDDEDLVFSAPLSLSLEDFKAVKTLLLDLVKSVSNRVAESSPELLVTFNIDWVRHHHRPS